MLDLLDNLVGLGHFPEDAADNRHPFAIYPDPARTVTAWLAHRANDILPRFVAEAGEIKLSLAVPGEWHNRRAAATFSRGLGRAEVAVDQLPSGLRTWALAAIEFARAQLHDGGWTARCGELGEYRLPPGSRMASDADSSTTTWKGNVFRDCEPGSITPYDRPVPMLMYLLDEPEAHPHLTAQQDVVDIAADLAGHSRGALVATHSLAFLNTPPGRTQLLTLSADSGRISASTWTGLTELAEHSGELGITPAALAQVCRGVLVVEGPDDKEVVQRYGGIDLDEQRIVIVVLQGAHGVAAIAELEFLHSVRIPIFLLLDHVRSGALEKAINSGARWGLRGEEVVLTKLHDALRQRRLQAHSLPYERIDIIRAVPHEEIQWALGKLGKPDFIGWSEIDARAKSAWRKSQTKFKETFERETGASVRAVMRQFAGDQRTGISKELHGILASMLDFIQDPSQPSAVVTIGGTL